MITSDAISYIRDELKYTAKTYFFDKYNALDSEISSDGFTYTTTSKTIVHQYKAVDDDYIIKVIYDEVLNVAMSSTPLSLLERVGNTSASMLKQVDKYWMIRKPSYPIRTMPIDIDDGLVQSVIYRALMSFGINKFVNVAKEMADLYANSVTIPDPFAIVSSVNFRFSSDGTSWHDGYVVGDDFMQISKDGVWGSSIPIGSGSQVVDEVGAKKFIELSDVATPLQPNKYLAVNNTGNGIVYVDAPASPSAVSSKSFSAIAGAYEIDVSGSSRVIYLDFSGSATLSISEDTNGDYELSNNERYTFVLSTNSNAVSFSASVAINGLTPISTSSLYTIITVLYINHQLYVMEQKDF